MQTKSYQSIKKKKKKTELGVWSTPKKSRGVFFSTFLYSFFSLFCGGGKEELFEADIFDLLCIAQRIELRIDRFEKFAFFFENLDFELLV